MDKPMWGVQQVEVYNDETTAQATLECLAQQVGFIGGRLISPAKRGWWEVPTDIPSATQWKLQVFYEDCGESNAANLPDGLRRVMLLPGFYNTLLKKGDLV